MFNNDVNEIGKELYSPSFGYPPQRIGDYDEILRGHITLNGPPTSKPVAQQKDWYQGSLYLQGLVGSIGESHREKKERRFNEVYG